MTFSTSPSRSAVGAIPQILGTCLHLVEQPDVLDGDHSLIGEGL